MPSNRLSAYPRTLAAALAAVVCCVPAAAVAERIDDPAAADRVSYRNEVLAALTKAGCNAGGCHGNLNGKGGFQLSLWGEDPEHDYGALAREFSGRRINPLDPDHSLILLKATGQLAHQGGVRFDRDAPEYRILRDWIAAGAPGPQHDGAPALERLAVEPRRRIVEDPLDRVQLQVTAHFADGSQRDVTRLAAYEPSNLRISVDVDGQVERAEFGESTVIVRYLDRQVPVQLAFIPAAPEFTWQAPPAESYIDEHVDAKLRSLRMRPASLADDTTFVRRAYLDALGLLPTAEESRRFVHDARPDKRAALVEELLARPEFAQHWALKWSDVLRNEEKVLDNRGVEAFHHWIRESITGGKPMDQFVRELVTASGSTYENPPANFYRANRDASVRGETTARLFLGVRLQCAECHNHPFDVWKQDDYYAWSANFARVDYDILENERRDNLDNNEFVGEQIVLLTDEGQVTNPRTGQPAVPGLLTTTGAPQGTLDDDGRQRLERVADWLTSPDNELFVKSQVNFVWYHLMGRGLVEPIDDFRATNPPVNPELLDALAADFVARDFDLRHLVRTIMTSRTYQLSAVPDEAYPGDADNFGLHLVRRLPAEKLLDAQGQVLQRPARFAGYPDGMRAGEMPGARRERRLREGDRFLMAFGKPERLLACECERSNETTLKQALLLIGSEDLHERLEHPQNRLVRLAGSGRPFDELVDELYWTALSRGPTEEELAAARQLKAEIREAGEKLAGGRRYEQLIRRLRELAGQQPPDEVLIALQDLSWALLNSKEFIFSH